MIAHPQPQLMAPQEFLEGKEQPPIKDAYINEQVFAMTEGTISHNDIALNPTFAFKNHLRGKGYKVRSKHLSLHPEPLCFLSVFRRKRRDQHPPVSSPLNYSISLNF